MANDERRMLFDTRGRRRHVIKLVYAVLALLMGASLFLVVGPFNLGEALNNSQSADATQALEDQAERIEGRLRTDPENEDLLLALSRARLNAGNTLMETNPQTGLPEATPEARAQFKQAVQAWSRYTEEVEAPNPAAASLVAGTYFKLAETSETVAETENYISDAAKAQAVAAKARPTVNALSSLAIYSYFDGNFAAGDAAAERLKQKVPKGQRKAVERQLTAYRQRGKTYNKEVQRILTSERGKGKEAFKNALGGLSPSGGAAPGQ